jgi:hypothetical protein
LPGNNGCLSHEFFSLKSRMFTMMTTITAQIYTGCAFAFAMPMMKSSPKVP